MILIHPPVVKPCEPPAGPAKLAGAMHDHDIPCKIIDANVEGVLSLLSEIGMGEHYPEMQIGDRSKEAIPKNLFSTWTNRSFRYLGSNITALTSWETYKNIDRYKRAVIDIDRVLEVAASESGAHLSLANYLDR
ncbi:MAG: hypothetical protein ACXWMH_12205, partial [Syntrophales bacterium]